MVAGTATADSEATVATGDPARAGAASASAPASPAPAPALSAPPRTKKVAYFLATHVCPEQILRLVKACRTGSPESRVVIHHDYKVSNLDPKPLSRMENVDLLSDHAPVDWGGFTQCVMIIRSMQWLLDHRAFDWVVYLSGQDYPIRPLRQIEQFLDETPYDGFLDAIPVEERSWRLGPQRYFYRYFNQPQFKGWGQLRRYLRHHAGKVRAKGPGHYPRIVIPEETGRGFRFGLRPLLGPFRGGFRCYAGSSWWTLNRRSIEYMVRFARENPALAKHYRRVQFAPNESYFLTILRNNPKLNLMTINNLRMISWTHPHTGHPDVFRAEDFNQLVCSDRHFARKIDQRVDPKLLDMLDKHIGLPR